MSISNVSPICFGPTISLDTKYQHQWFLVSPSLQCLDEKTCEALSQVQIQTHMGQLQLRASGMLRLELLLDVLEDDDELRCIALDNNVKIAAIDEGELAATWFSHIIGQPCRLLKKDPGNPDIQLTP